MELSISCVGRDLAMGQKPIKGVLRDIPQIKFSEFIMKRNRPEGLNHN